MSYWDLTWVKQLSISAALSQCASFPCSSSNSCISLKISLVCEPPVLPLPEFQFQKKGRRQPIPSTRIINHDSLLGVQISSVCHRTVVTAADISGTEPVRQLSLLIKHFRHFSQDFSPVSHLFCRCRNFSSKREDVASQFLQQGSFKPWSWV